MPRDLLARIRSERMMSLASRPIALPPFPLEPLGRSAEIDFEGGEEDEFS